MSKHNYPMPIEGIDHIIEVFVVVCGDDYGKIQFDGLTVDSPLRLSNEKAVVLKGFSESNPTHLVYVLVGHHKGNVYHVELDIPQVNAFNLSNLFNFFTGGY